MPVSDAQGFAGSVPELYERLLVPLIFEPYAVDLVQRLARRAPARVLEIACGTGVVTREMARALPTHSEIVATDLQPPMLAQAQAIGTPRPVQWRQADAMRLPFEAASFDAVVCQFGAMFFPDRGVAFGEMHRVLKPGGRLLFNVWDRIEDNEFADVVTAAMAERYPADPPRFLARTPHGVHDAEALRSDLKRGGFTAAPRVETVTARSRAASARDVAVAYCQGTPLRGEIEARDPSGLGVATDVAEAALVRRFGSGEVDGRIQALVIEVDR